MLVVGITGGIGSGKTAVTNLFTELGIVVVDADIAARIVVEPGRRALNEIAEHFGPTILLPDGTLNRAAMRARVFANPDDRRLLERITHPRIAEEIAQQLKAATSPYVILVSPLLIEGDQHKFCDRILVVDVPEEIQLQRTMQRDNNDAELVKRIIASQATRAQRTLRADDIIENTGTVEQLQEKVLKLHQQYLQLASSAT
jgi:dephospho-CoA kinase